MSNQSTIIQCVLDAARSQIGTLESPANSNKTKYGKWYGLDGNPWCMMFVQWCFAQAGQALPYKTASCSDLLNWYRKNQPDRVNTTAQPGDIVIYSFGHTGIVESVGIGQITAIEGNTSPGNSGSQDNGGGVFRRTRKLSQVRAFIHPKLKIESEEKPMDNIIPNNVPSPAHQKGVDWAIKNGLLSGNAQGDLMLTQPITRQQFCTMLLRYHEKFGR